MAKKNRSLRELLILLSKSEKIFKERECSGLCRLVAILNYIGTITNEERFLLDRYIDNKRPKYAEHFLWYWPICKWKPRKAWLDSRIALKRL